MGRIVVDERGAARRPFDYRYVVAVVCGVVVAAWFIGGVILAVSRSVQ